MIQINLGLVSPRLRTIRPDLQHKTIHTAGSRNGKWSAISGRLG